MSAPADTQLMRIKTALMMSPKGGECQCPPRVMSSVMGVPNLAPGPFERHGSCAGAGLRIVPGRLKPLGDVGAGSCRIT